MLEMTQYWYSWFQGFSGQKFYLEMGLQAFNVLYTGGYRERKERDRGTCLVARGKRSVSKPRAKTL